MSDLISRQAAMDAIKRYASYNYDLNNGLGLAMDAIANMVADVQTIDSVKHGKWEYRNTGGWHCSVCDEQAPFWCMASTQNLGNYCYNCGARMDLV